VHVTGCAAEEWRKTGPELHRLGLLTVADVTVFEAYCVAYGRWRELEEQLVGAELLVQGSRKNLKAIPYSRLPLTPAGT
jgi:P27 family predicted phage terminase small subunit